MNYFSKILLLFFGFGADIVSVTSGTAGSAGNVVADLITYLSDKLLEVAEFNLVLDQFGERYQLPSNNSKTMRFVREEKFTVASSPTQLTEGIPPDAIPVTLNQFEAVMEQYGQVVRLSELAELTARHPIVSKTIFNLGLQAAETYDQLVYNVLDAATNSYRPNNKAADANLVGGDRLTYVDLVELVSLLSEQGGRSFDQGDYVLVAAPQVVAGLQNDPDYKAANQFGMPDRLWRGEIGTLAGFRVVKSNSPAFAVTTSAVGGVSNKVFSSFALARNAYQVVDLQNMQIYVQPPGGHTDPLHQSHLMGWKFAFKALITNQNWIRRVRTSGASSVTN